MSRDTFDTELNAFQTQSLIPTMNPYFSQIFSSGRSLLSDRLTFLLRPTRFDRVEIRRSGRPKKGRTAKFMNNCSDVCRRGSGRGLPALVWNICHTSQSERQKFRKKNMLSITIPIISFLILALLVINQFIFSFQTHAGFTSPFAPSNK